MEIVGTGDWAKPGKAFPDSSPTTSSTFAHDPRAPTPGFPACAASISISDWLTIAKIKPFPLTLQLKFEDFLIQSTAMGELRRIGEHVKIQDEEFLELHFPLFFHKTREQHRIL